ncbi:response regulator transcription factor [Chitinophaga solisilvae]|uniref:Helix-turn-helix transcriptional regulator n=1 Tax=Chitinophaga solisilvae TaxID=1233460 RepID=A0A3S1JGG1_9BACT|nr:helix-turn-helix transcriptional regulator [Chitinophaga solisilvae]NSL85278.1 helix-turn-helix transcriptional regulator [Chitinophaga solisilvae]
MKNDRYSSLLTKNHLGKQPEQQQDYLEAVKAIARLTYESLYIIDYADMSFEYVSDNPLFLCGYTAAEVLQSGYDFYFRHVPEPDLELLNIINETGFNFFKTLPVAERKELSITYDFHLISKDGKPVLINHKLTPLLMTPDGNMWKALCIVSISHHQTAGHARIYRQHSADVWKLDVKQRRWRKSRKPALTERETAVLRLHAQGLTISQIAEKLFVSPDTVKYYRRRIFERLEVNSIVEALSYAINSRII